MFGIIFTNKADGRNLLLEYSRNEYPLLKEYPCEGFDDMYFDIGFDEITYVQNDFIEL